MWDVSREVISKHCILQNSLVAGNMGDIPAYSFSGERHPTRHWGCIIWTLHETARAARVFMSLVGLDLSPGAAAALTRVGAMEAMLEPSMHHWGRQRKWSTSR